ncbi:MAG: YraN family protein [Bacteroidales bacterium]|nr:YraN family protein [Bacteroidales bacterium]
MARHNHLGKKGEQLAKEYLLQKGWQLLEENWRFEHKEVDLIFREGDELIIVEVKTRSTDYFGNPEEAVSEAKEEHLIQAAEAYLEEHNLNTEVRYDVVAIILKNRQYEITHIPDAFYPR